MSEAKKQLAEGIYRGTAGTHSLGRSNKGTPFVEIPVTITKVAQDPDNPSGDYQEVQAPFKRSLFVYITPACRNMAIKSLKMAGYDREAVTVASLNPKSPTAFVFAGKEVTVEMKREEFKGVWREKWEVCRKNLTPLAPEDLSQLDQVLSAPEPADDPNLFS